MKRIILIILISMMGIAALSGCLETKQPYQVAYQEAYEEAYQSPVYTTFISGTLIDVGLLSNTRFTFNNYITMEKEYTGKDGWGNSEYIIVLCKPSGCIKYNDINTWTVTSDTIQTGTETKYKTSYRTAYRIEYR